MALPFLTYLTVCRSRLGAANLVLSETSLGSQPAVAVERKVRRVLERKRTVPAESEAGRAVVQYAADKHLLGGRRYPNYRLVVDGPRHVIEGKGGERLVDPEFYLTDLWMSSPAVLSTVGVPTPENTSEIIGLTQQLRLTSKATSTWTAAGYLARQLRAYRPPIEDPDNPFALGLETVAFFRQILLIDGPLQHALVLRLCELGAGVRRADAIAEFRAIVDAAMTEVRAARIAPDDLRALHDFQTEIRKQHAELLRQSPQVADGGRVSRAPGVLEHRIAPRLEWLTDLGYLSKEGRARNSFEYQVEPSLARLSATMSTVASGERWAEDVVLSEWWSNAAWGQLRSGVGQLRFDEALRASYRLLRRQIGPAPVRDVAFVAALMCEEPLGMATAVEQLVTFAQVTDGVTLSGGRYRQGPENIYAADSALG